jgi:hypothetical protein
MRIGRISAITAASIMAVGTLAGVAGAGTASATSYEVIKIKSWDGYCLSISTATVGTRLDQVPCADAHNWWLTPGWDLYPEGHANAQVGDSGGYLKLKAAGTGTAVYEAGLATGPGNVVYQQLWFDVPGTYWHADGNGHYVTFDNTPGDHANYWYLQDVG